METSQQPHHQQVSGAAAKLEKRACAICGNAFTPKNKLHALCSPTCYSANNRIYQREWYKRRNEALGVKSISGHSQEISSCSECGEKFAKSRVNHHACSKRCQRARHERMKDIRIGAAGTENAKKRTCIVCGVTFTKKSNGAEVTCGTACRYKRRQELKAEERRRSGRVRSPEKLKTPAEVASTTCAVCGNLYKKQSVSRRSVACSDRCKNLRRNALHAAIYYGIRGAENRDRFVADYIARDESRKKTHPRMARERSTPEPRAKTKPVTVWEAPAAICCRGCGRSVPRESAVLDCCGMECAGAVMQRISVKALSEELDIGTPVLVRRARVMSIDGRERLIDTSDAGRITAIFGGVASIESEGRALVAPETDIERTVGAVQRIKLRIDGEREETYRKRNNAGEFVKKERIG